MKDLLEGARNEFDFFLRTNLAFSRSNYKESGVDLSKVYSSLPKSEQILISNLLAKYQFEPYLRNLSAASFFDNIMHLAILEQISDQIYVRNPKSLLDVGSKNFCYVVALHCFLRSLSLTGPRSNQDPIAIDGVEIDAGRTYSNLYSRKSCAAYYCKLIPSSQYFHKDVLEVNAAVKYDLITHFFPFVEKVALLDWGLPIRFFKPLAIASKLYELLERDGQLIVANTTAEEYHDTRSILDATKFKFVASSKINHSFTSKELYISVYSK